MLTRAAGTSGWEGRVAAGLASLAEGIRLCLPAPSLPPSLALKWPLTEQENLRQAECAGTCAIRFGDVMFGDRKDTPPSRKNRGI